jgi:hypothetical protein
MSYTTTHNLSEAKITQTEIVTVAIGGGIALASMMAAGSYAGQQLCGKWGAIAGGAAAAILSSATTVAGANIVGKLSFREKIASENNNPELRQNSLGI